MNTGADAMKGKADAHARTVKLVIEDIRTKGITGATAIARAAGGR